MTRCTSRKGLQNYHRIWTKCKEVEWNYIPVSQFAGGWLNKCFGIFFSMVGCVVQNCSNRSFRSFLHLKRKHRKTYKYIVPRWLTCPAKAAHRLVACKCFDMSRSYTFMYYCHWLQIRQTQYFFHEFLCSMNRHVAQTRQWCVIIRT